MRYSIFAFLVFVLSLSGCGYSLVGSKSSGIASIKIGRIENKTHEPKLEDILKNALAEELMRHGIGIDPKAAYELTGTIEKLQLRGLSEKGGFFSEYSVTVSGNFSLKDNAGNTIKLRGEGPFSVYFPSEAALATVIALKEDAIKRALHDLASELAASIIYR